jgi:exonuclease III
MTGITTYLSILILNLNGFNSPHQKTPFGKLDENGRSNNLLFTGDPVHWQKEPWLRVKRWKKIYQASDSSKQAEVAILISDKVNFKLTLIKWHKEGHFTLIKGEIYQKEITIINLHVPKVSEPNFIKHTLKDLKAYINSNTVLVGVSNTTLSPMYRSSIQKINKEILELSHTIDQMDLADIYRIVHPTFTQYIFFSAAMELFPKLIIS